MCISKSHRKTVHTPLEETIRTVGRGFGIFHEMWRAYPMIIAQGAQKGILSQKTVSETLKKEQI